MSVPVIIERINYCQRWISVCNSFGDLDYQRRCWFRMEGHEVSSYEEDFAHMDTAWNMFVELKLDNFLDKKCNKLIKLFTEKLYNYNSDPKTFLNSTDEDVLLNDPKWMEIVMHAQKAEYALQRFEKELNNVEGR